MICSFRLNPNIQQDFNLQWLGFNHEFNCHTDASTTVIENVKKI